MITHLIALVSLAVLYGLAWHDRSAREHESVTRPETRQDHQHSPKRSA